MSSEAAQKAYPEPEIYVTLGYQMEQQARREGFDRGAVEALRQAERALHAVNMPQAAWLVDGMADEWERGSA